MGISCLILPEMKENHFYSLLTLNIPEQPNVTDTTSSSLIGSQKLC